MHDPDRPGREVDHDHEVRPEPLSGGVRQDVVLSEHLNLAIEDVRVRPVAGKPGGTRRNGPLAVSDDASYSTATSANPRRGEGGP